MIREHTTTARERGESQAEIEICTLHCPHPDKLCDGECEFYKAQAKKIRKSKPVKKKVILY